jgi:thiol-disulfide isomerase/thioredoxin
MHARLAPAALLVIVASVSAQSDKPAPPAKSEPPRSIPATPLTKPAPSPEEKVEVTLHQGDKAPAIAFDKWVKGDEVKAFQPGKVYVVEFWATWCGPCIASIPHLTDLQKQHKDVTFIGIAASERPPQEGKPDERLAHVEQFVKEKGDAMAYRVAFDGKRAMGKTWMRAAGQGGIPCAFLVNGEGKIAWIGHPNDLEPELDRVLGKPATAAPPAKTPAKK